jgi:hypothetical protein
MGEGASGPNKRAHNTFSKEKRAKRQLFAEAQKGKRQPAKERASQLTRKNAYSWL